MGAERTLQGLRLREGLMIDGLKPLGVAPASLQNQSHEAVEPTSPLLPAEKHQAATSAERLMWREATDSKEKSPSPNRRRRGFSAS